jgi:hypothetical protein
MSSAADVPGTVATGGSLEIFRVGGIHGNVGQRGQDKLAGAFPAADAATVGKRDQFLDAFIDALNCGGCRFRVIVRNVMTDVFEA